MDWLRIESKEQRKKLVKDLLEEVYPSYDLDSLSKDEQLIFCKQHEQEFFDNATIIKCDSCLNRKDEVKCGECIVSFSQEYLENKTINF